MQELALTLTLTLTLALTLGPEAAAAASSDGLVQISEVSDKGATGVCEGEDWIELHLADSAATALDLGGYILHDDNGPEDADAFTFPAGLELSPGQYALICTGAEDASTSPQFGIGGTDAVTLLDAAGAVAASTGALGGRGELDVTFAYDEAAGGYVYTTTPTPGSANAIAPLPEPETVDEMRARLIDQNERGSAFFNMDGAGLEVEGGFADLVDLRIEMEASSRQEMHDERSYETYRPFLSATVTSSGDPDGVLLDLPSGGRIRPKGQSTLYFGTCMDRTVPYSVDFDRGSDPSQTLFGVQRAYLRTHFGDGSHSREWAMHRMLARFGLPHLRTRTVRLFLNGEYEGLYDVVEAPNQEHVFQRSFPGFDPEEYGLYKVKTLSLGCGNDDDPGFTLALAGAEKRIDDLDTPPYRFERGEHRPIISVKEGDWIGCSFDFFTNIQAEFEDVALAFLRKNATCGEFLVDQGLIDRDLGGKGLDNAMELFINRHLAGSKCDDGCANSDLADDVDNTNFLRNIAVMASVLHTDSPLGNGNNFYLAYNDALWSMVQYDHNNILSDSTAELLCSPECKANLMKWSILRPTCRSLEGNQMAGPLLSDDNLRAQYVEYVREFVDDVMSNEDFLSQLRKHIEAIEDASKSDPWNDFAPLFDAELSSGDTWQYTFGSETYVPLLPAMRARAQEIEKQLEAIDSGTFPRDLDDIGSNEACVAWDADGPRASEDSDSSSGCPDNCIYDGCYREDFIVPAFCDPTTNRCMHGTSDSKCAGVPNTTGYAGISRFDGSDEIPFCWTDPNAGSLKIAFCPAKDNGSDSDRGSSEDSGGLMVSFAISFAVQLVVALAFA